jgi:alpha-L-fucosidase 2
MIRLLLYSFITFLITENSFSQISKYNVNYNTLCQHSMESMPLGNGDIGINIWTDTLGIHFYMGKTDTWSGIGRLLKPGLIDLSFKPSPFKNINSFSQELKLENGEIVIHAISDSIDILVKCWVDVDYPVIRMEIESEKKFEYKVELKNWRQQQKEIIDNGYMHSAYGMKDSPAPVIIEPDSILENNANRICWLHRNTISIYSLNLQNQGLGDLVEKYPDPLINRTFGGLVTGENLISKDKKTLISKHPSQHFTFSVFLHTNQTDSLNEWIKEINEICRKDTIEPEARRIAHQKWWADFWNKSYIDITGTDETFKISQGYALQRFITACAGRGAYPIKFNGSIFTVDPVAHGLNYDADYRKWGGCYWFQNTRLIYYPMFMSGDFEMQMPLFDMYMNALPIQKEATKKRFGHEGAYIGETVHFWGTYNNNNWGWGNQKNLPANKWIKRDYNGTLELLGFMMDHYEFTQDSVFATNYLIPYAKEILTFFSQHFSRDEDDKLYIYPSQSLETWGEATNPTTYLAGLHFIIPRLISLPQNLISGETTNDWNNILQSLPQIPVDIIDGKEVILPAYKYSNLQNSENPELYSIFPYRVYGVGKDDIELAKHTFNIRKVKGTNGWRQDAIQAAFIGETEIAGKYVYSNFSTPCQECRFPGFYGPNFDWIPDQDHGNVASIALQRMLCKPKVEGYFYYPHGLRIGMPNLSFTLLSIPLLREK